MVDLRRAISANLLIGSSRPETRLNLLFSQDISFTKFVNDLLLRSLPSVDFSRRRSPVPHYLVVMPAKDASSRAQSFFKRGLSVAHDYFDCRECGPIIQTEAISAASFSRADGSGPQIAKSPGTQSWLLSAGTWFYGESLASGQEADLLSVYLETGIESISAKLDGFFNIIVWDERKNELVIVNDISGSLFCFVRDFGDMVAISSSSLMLAALDSYTLDPVGCQEYLYSGTIYENRTFFNEVRRLSPATIHQFANGKRTGSGRYWHMSNLDPAAITDGPQAIELLQDTLCGAVKKITKTYTKPVCDLTGGYDSRMVFSSFLSAGITPTTFVAGLPDDADVKASGAIARKFDVPHLQFTKKQFVPYSEAKRVLSYTDGEFDLLEYVDIYEAQKHSQDKGYNFSVIGNFGELSRGKHWKKKLLLPAIGSDARLDTKKFAEYNFHAFYIQDSSLFPAESRIDAIRNIAGVIERENSGLDGFPNTVQVDNIYLYMKMRCWYGRIASSTEKIRPCISLFQFRSVIDTMLQIDWKLRQNNALLNQILAKYQPRLATSLLDNGCPAMTMNWRNFYRFSPLLKNHGLRAARFAKRRILGKSIAFTALDRESVRLQLWEDEEVRALLNPEEMNVGRVMDREALSSFLIRSQGTDFAYDRQWKWLLSLEHSLAFLESIRVS